MDFGPGLLGNGGHTVKYYFKSFQHSNGILLVILLSCWKTTCRIKKNVKWFKTTVWTNHQKGFRHPTQHNPPPNGTTDCFFFGNRFIYLRGNPTGNCREYVQKSPSGVLEIRQGLENPRNAFLSVESQILHGQHLSSLNTRQKARWIHVFPLPAYNIRTK